MSAFWFRIRFDVFCMAHGARSRILGVRMFSIKWFVVIVCKVSWCILGRSLHMPCIPLPQLRYWLYYNMDWSIRESFSDCRPLCWSSMAYWDIMSLP